ncbi:MAG: 1,4-alpha-glucan branching enzyme [Candidatus Electronema aureum]|uniref:1,4-alpha-glucan branching enzyme GlgB n=1 Tax=Candidatus Electronema aureum TaxID=2005002 RepID=A0A521G225_9BACT|nr:MAG: 1,4-alpha-glucan branching enzyme [Candidatus Electronema aureum]
MTTNSISFPGQPAPATWLSDFDKYLIGEGTHERAYEKLGAHLVSFEGKAGIVFAVWAPNAREVSIIGDFNDWDGKCHPMHSSDSGIWSLFIPGLKEYTVYKYRLITQQGEQFDKSDPYGFAMELRPATGSVAVNLDSYQWGDGQWLNERAQRQSLDSPISIYEVHLASWQRQPDEKYGSRYLTYRELAETLIPYVLKMGYTHIELLPIAEHPFDGSWGYQVLGFFAPTSRFGTPQDFMYFVDQCHQHNIGVIVDWVPAHFPKDGAGLNYFDGTHLYAHEDPRQGEHQDWGTMIFNYGRNEVRSFLISNALFWIDKYHIDGLRVDAVASMLYLDYSRKEGEWLPNEHGGRENLAAISFLRKTNEVVHGLFPGVLTIAEESTSWPMVSRPTWSGGLGFSLKWNMGWMHDTLSYMCHDSIHRRFHHNEITFGMLYAFHENFILPISHDEVVHGKGSLVNKMPGDDWQKFANLRAYLGFMWSYPGKKLLFMGCDFGQWQEWNHDKGLEWQALEAENHQGVQRFVQDLNQVYKNEPTLHENDYDWTGFSWINANDSDNSVFSFIRRAKNTGDQLVVVCNLTPVVREKYRIGTPQGGEWRELINSDLAIYWGSGISSGVTASQSEPSHGCEHTLELTLPPLSVLILKPA